MEFRKSSLGHQSLLIQKKDVVDTEGSHGIKGEIVFLPSLPYPYPSGHCVRQGGRAFWSS